jgi:hypothetical protein
MATPMLLQIPLLCSDTSFAMRRNQLSQNTCQISVPDFVVSDFFKNLQERGRIFL